jgi:hypothetical protein
MFSLNYDPYQVLNEILMIISTKSTPSIETITFDK